MSQKAQLQIPPKLIPVFNTPNLRYRGAYGGRGSAKTRTFALMTAVQGYRIGQGGGTGQILCGREFMNSLDDSSLEEVKSAIRSVPWLEDYYELGEKYIKSKDGRINYVFAGLRRSLDALKSKAKLILAWIDEAETVSETAWRKLIPTVREHDSEIWVTWNPESKESATHKRFRQDQPDNSLIVEMNWQDNPWFPDVLEQERIQDKNKRPDIYDHVWEGDFLVHAEGAYYATEMREAKDQGRIDVVNYETSTGVITAWDLGIGDSTAIWFAQFIGPEVRIIDYYESSGVGLDHYARVLQEKGYTYREHILPHDVRVKELGSGKSRLETLEALGVSPVTIAPQLMVDDGIQAARSMLKNCWFDAERCDRGIDALRQYHREYDDNGKVWRSRPSHDWASHGADAFRYLAVGYRPAQTNWGEPIRRNLRGIA
jgi:phage terminase large subunit